MNWTWLFAGYKLSQTIECSLDPDLPRGLPSTYAASEYFLGPELAATLKVKDTSHLRESLTDIAEATASPPAAATVTESAAKSQPAKSEALKDEGKTKAAAAESKSAGHPPAAPKDAVKDLPAASHPVSRVLLPVAATEMLVQKN